MLEHHRTITIMLINRYYAMCWEPFFWEFLIKTIKFFRTALV